MTRFADRHAAGQALADALRDLRGVPGLVALGLPRGGVPVAYEVARALCAPLDVVIVRKLGVPDHEELAMGAIAGGSILIRNERIIVDLHIPESEVRRVTESEQEEIRRRDVTYRQGRPPLDLRGQTIVLVDDGMATGSTMRAAARAVRQQDPKRITIAVPVGSLSACAALRDVADEVVCLITPEGFFAVGEWYEDFRQTTDDEVCSLLTKKWSLKKWSLKIGDGSRLSR